MKTARVLITTKCNRTCHYCCNEQEQTIPSAKQLTAVGQLWPYEAVVISGGEPMLYPKRVIAFAKAIKAMNKDIPIYMYSATHTKHMDEVMQYVDGITYTVHQEANIFDVELFSRMQNTAARYRNKKFHLTIHDECAQYIPICPSLWKKVQFFHHKEECLVPPNETLYTLAFQAE